MLRCDKRAAKVAELASSLSNVEAPGAPYLSWKAGIRIRVQLRLWMRMRMRVRVPHILPDAAGGVKYNYWRFTGESLCRPRVMEAAADRP